MGSAPDCGSSSNGTKIQIPVYYRPQTKFVKVMFLHLSVILSMGRGLPQCMLGYTPPPRVDPQEADTPLGSRHPPGSRHPHEADTPREQTPPQQQTPPCAVHAGRYRQEVGGMHPTGMHTCFENNFTSYSVYQLEY